MEDVQNRGALLHARVAALDKSNATLKLAPPEFARAEQFLPNATISHSLKKWRLRPRFAARDQVKINRGGP
jgi:hypothetical protein